MYIYIYICEHNSERDEDGYRKGYGVDPPLNHLYPIQGQQAYTIIIVGLT